MLYSGVLWRETTESRDGLGKRWREKVLTYAEHGGKRLEALRGAAHGGKSVETLADTMVGEKSCTGHYGRKQLEERSALFWQKSRRS